MLRGKNTFAVDQAHSIALDHKVHAAKIQRHTVHAGVLYEQVYIKYSRSERSVVCSHNLATLLKDRPCQKQIPIQTVITISMSIMSMTQYCASLLGIHMNLYRYRTYPNTCVDSI